MTATVTVNEAGQLDLPESVVRVFGLRPGVKLRAEATADRIEILKDPPVVTEGVLEDGILILPRMGLKMDAAEAVNEVREEQAGRSLPE